MMKKTAFIEGVAEILDVEPSGLSEASILSDYGFDSVATLSLLAWVRLEFGVELTSADVRGLSDVASLMDAVGREHIEG
ncbi:hypothetical protein JCM14469_40300 [Desulfatiferula olefinivorans]